MCVILVVLCKLCEKLRYFLGKFTQLATNLNSGQYIEGIEDPPVTFSSYYNIDCWYKQRHHNDAKRHHNVMEIMEMKDPAPLLNKD